MYSKVKSFLGIGSKKDKNDKNDKKEQTSVGVEALQPAPLQINMDDLGGSKKASHGVGGSEASHKAIRPHRKHSASQTKPAPQATDPVDASKSGKSNDTLDHAWRQEEAVPSERPKGRSAFRKKVGFVDPDGNRLSDDDVQMMKLMLTQVLESYLKQIQIVYEDKNINIDKNLKETKYYSRFCDKNKQLVNVKQIPEKDLVILRGYEKQAHEAIIDEAAKPILLSNIQGKINSLRGDIDVIHKGTKPQSASSFLKDYMADPLNYTGEETERSSRLRGIVLSAKGVTDFETTLNAVSAEFEENKNEVLDGIGDVKKYNGKSKKLAGARMQGSSTLNGEIENLFSISAKFKDAVNQDEVLKKANDNKPFDSAHELSMLVGRSNDLSSRVLDIIEMNKLTDSVKSIANFSKASSIASKHAKKLKSSKAVSFSDLMRAYMDINIGVGEKGESDDGKMKAQWAGTSSGSIVGPSGDAISADLFLLFHYVAKTMNEIKAIQKKQPSIAKSRAVKLAGIVNTITISAHTFVNGNGRTCRLLADAILESFELPPASVNTTITGVAGLFGELYANDDQKAAGEKDFDRSTKGYLDGVLESDRRLRAK